MKKMLMLAIGVILSLSQLQAQVERPKLVVGFVVDQMRWDYLYYYYDRYRTDGLRRLLAEGYSFGNTMIGYVPTVTAVGHSALFTGAAPSMNGIAGNWFYDQDKAVYCCQDNKVKSVGSNSAEGQMSPHRMLSTTIGDELKIATDYKSKVIGVALKDRAAILPAGHGADAAYWWDKSAGHFVTSTYYMDKLPDWVEKFNKTHSMKPGTDPKMLPEGVDVTFAMAEAAIDNENLGNHDVTDMLTVSISSTDAIGHAYGTRGKENWAAYEALDRGFAHFLKVLDEKVGKGNYLLFFTADHGAAHNYNVMRSHRIPAGAFDWQKSVSQVNDYMEQTMGIRPVGDEDNYQYFIIDSIATSNGHTKQEVIDCIINYLRQDSQFMYVVDNEKVVEATIPEPLKQMIINGYRPGRSGEITVVTRPGYFGAEDSPKYTGTSHGQWNPYDSHIPLVFLGWHVPHGESTATVHNLDIAPTVCAMLHIQMPNGCMGEAREMK